MKAILKHGICEDLVLRKFDRKIPVKYKPLLK